MSFDEVRLLVVEDQVEVAEALACGLKLDGYRVRVAHDGVSARALIEVYLPHCVLLDIDLPGIDGNELSRRVRAEHGDDIVQIAVTSSNVDEERVFRTFDRVDHYLRKPVDPASLRKVLPPLAR